MQCQSSTVHDSFFKPLPEGGLILRIKQAVEQLLTQPANQHEGWRHHLRDHATRLIIQRHFKRLESQRFAGVAIVHAGHVVLCNEQFKHLLHDPAQHDRSLMSHFPDQDELDKFLADYADAEIEHRRFSGQYRLRKFNGETFLARVSSRQLGWGRTRRSLLVVTEAA